MSAETHSQFADGDAISLDQIAALDREIAELDELLTTLLAELQDD